MTASQFREQLHRSLNLRLSKEEVAAIMHHFDDNGDGLVLAERHLKPARAAISRNDWVVALPVRSVLLSFCVLSKCLSCAYPSDRYIECHEFVLHFFSAAFRLRSEQRSSELNAQATKERAARDAKKAAELAEEAANFHILTCEN
jgi:hypothetical protein